ncbi:Uncharacterised protein [Klebsiella variicola]|nr:Uncharacterised protein [Klebsiella variicola]
MRTPDRGSTTGAASWTDREPASGLPRRGERSESIPPSPPYFKKSSYASTGFFSSVAPAGGMRTPDRGSTTGAASWTDREPASGLPRRGERSESIPPSPPYFKKSSYASTAFFSHVALTRGMRTPDRGSTTGAASWTDREPASGLPRRGERSESIPPSPPYFKKSSYASTGFFSSVAPAGGMRTPDQGSTTGNRHYAVLSKPDSFSHD